MSSVTDRQRTVANVGIVGQPFTWPEECFGHRNVLAENQGDMEITFVHGDHRRTVEVHIDPQATQDLQKELDRFVWTCHEYDEGEDER